MIKKTLPILALLGLIGISERLGALPNYCFCMDASSDGKGTQINRFDCVGKVKDKDDCIQQCKKLMYTEKEAAVVHTRVQYEHGTRKCKL
jgi:hypothetical protein